MRSLSCLHIQCTLAIVNYYVDMQFVVTFIISKTKIVGTDSVVSLTKQRQGHLRVLYDITDYEKFSLMTSGSF